jgi:hypothetical protein
MFFNELGQSNDGPCWRDTLNPQRVLDGHRSSVSIGHLRRLWVGQITMTGDQ